MHLTPTPRPGPRARATHPSQPLPSLPPTRPRRAPLPCAAEAPARSSAPSSLPLPPPAAAAVAPVTDDSVPEGHKGLHASLYGEGGAVEAHGVAGQTEAVYEVVPGEDGGEAVLPLQPWLAARESTPPIAGVFAIYDAHRALQFVSFARHAPRAVRAAAARAGEDRAAFVRALLFANKAMVTKKALEEQADRWLAEAGTLPPGNGVEKALWEREGAVKDGMSAAEAEEHDGRKAKLEAAMGVKGSATAPEPSTPEEKRQAWMKAVGKGDWSAVIDGQTASTTPGGVAPGEGGGLAAAMGGPPSPTSPPVTPFARAAVHRKVGADAAAAAAASASGSPALTVEAAEAALDEVRPYLIADGGNVEVLSVEGGRILLKLQGACGSCASSGATMTMGIERALKATFGAAVKEVIEVGGAGGGGGSAAAGPPPASVEAVDGHLSTLRPALAAYGATVEPVSIKGGVCMVRYTGPAPILMGVTAALKDRFPDIKDVKEWLEEDYE